MIIAVMPTGSVAQLRISSNLRTAPLEYPVNLGIRMTASTIQALMVHVTIHWLICNNRANFKYFGTGSP